MRAQRILEERYSYISLLLPQYFDIKEDQFGYYVVTGELSDMPENYLLPGSVEIRGKQWRVVITEPELKEIENLPYWHDTATKAGFKRAEGHTYVTPTPFPTCSH